MVKRYDGLCTLRGRRKSVESRKRDEKAGGLSPPVMLMLGVVGKATKSRGRWSLGG